MYPEVLPCGTRGQARPTRQPGPRQGSSLTGRLLPPVSSLAVRSPPAASRYEADPRRQEQALEELESELAGAHGDTAARHARVRALPGHSKARGGAHKVRKGKAVLTRAKSEG